MDVFKTYYKLINKHKISMILYIFIFVSFSIFYTTSSSRSNIIKSTVKTIGVVDNGSSDKNNKALKKYLKKEFTVLPIKNNEATIKEALISGYVDYILKIKNDNLFYYSINPNTSFIVNAKINEYLNINHIMNYYKISDSNNKTLSIISKNPSIDKINKKENSSTRVSLYFYFNYLSYVFFPIIVLGAFQLENKFYNSSVTNRIAIGGKSFKYINKWGYLSVLSFALSLFAVMNFVGIILFGIKNFLLYYNLLNIINSLLLVVTILPIALFLGAISKNGTVNSAIANTLSLLLCFISGVFIPLELMPNSIIKIAHLSPIYWTNIIYINIRDNKFYTQATYIGIIVQILFTATFTLLTLIVHKSKGQYRQKFYKKQSIQL